MVIYISAHVWSLINPPPSLLHVSLGSSKLNSHLRIFRIWFSYIETTDFLSYIQAKVVMRMRKHQHVLTDHVLHKNQ